MTGRGYLARLTLIAVSVVICGLLVSQVSVADFKGNQPEARKLPWPAGSWHFMSGACGLCAIFPVYPVDKRPTGAILQPRAVLSR